jgi:hypothetical protein
LEKLYKATIWSQAIYTFITAVWPIVNIKTFMLVSGYKTDIWLVKTVSVLLLAISICLLVNASSNKFNFPIVLLSLLVAIGMAYVDFYYSINGTISKIYMADGFVEILFVIGWFVIILKKSRRSGIDT